jgi:hypothetical protein
VPIDDFILDHLPSPLGAYLRKHKELVKFLLVGGTAFVVDSAIFLLMKNTVPGDQPVPGRGTGQLGGPGRTRVPHGDLLALSLVSLQRR